MRGGGVRGGGVRGGEVSGGGLNGGGVSNGGVGEGAPGTTHSIVVCLVGTVGTPNSGPANNIDPFLDAILAASVVALMRPLPPATSMMQGWGEVGRNGAG